MSLGPKQERFTEALTLLLAYAHFKGYRVRMGDVFRDPRAFGHVGEDTGPYGHKNSCHKLKLAADLNLTASGHYLAGAAAEGAHNELHDFWDMLGGAKRIPHDLNHYSFEHAGFR